MTSLCERITRWLKAKGAMFHPTDFSTVQVGDGPETIERWNDTLGARPTAADLAPFDGPAGPDPRMVRLQRDLLLQESDWTQLPDAPLTASQKAVWISYRKALRDITRQPTFPAVVWPNPPS